MSDNYKSIKKIGEGSFGQVYLVHHKTENKRKKVVMKKIDFPYNKPESRASAKRECDILKTFNHPNIITYINSFEEDNCLCIIMTYCKDGDLYTRLKSRRGRLIQEDQIMEWFIQIVMALSYMHEKKVLHRDLKTQNIFLHNSVLKVGDLGVAKQLLEGEDMAQSFVGTPYYMSPEMLLKIPYNLKSDIWALGCVTYEMATLQTAFSAKSLDELSHKVLTGRIANISDKYSKDLSLLVKTLMSLNPDQRPSTDELLNNPFIRVYIIRFVDKLSKFERENLNIDTRRDSITKGEFAHSPEHGKSRESSSFNLKIDKTKVHLRLSVIGKSDIHQSRSSTNLNKVEEGKIIDGENNNVPERKRTTSENAGQVDQSNSAKMSSGASGESLNDNHEKKRKGSLPRIFSKIFKQKTRNRIDSVTDLKKELEKNPIFVRNQSREFAYKSFNEKNMAGLKRAEAAGKTTENVENLKCKKGLLNVPDVPIRQRRFSSCDTNDVDKIVLQHLQSHEHDNHCETVGEHVFESMENHVEVGRVMNNMSNILQRHVKLKDLDIDFFVDALEEQPHTVTDELVGTLKELHDSAKVDVINAIGERMFDRIINELKIEQNSLQGRLSQLLGEGHKDQAEKILMCLLYQSQSKDS